MGRVGFLALANSCKLRRLILLHRYPLSCFSVGLFRVRSIPLIGMMLRRELEPYVYSQFVDIIGGT